jgi:hypothetical protein
MHTLQRVHDERHVVVGDTRSRIGAFLIVHWRINTSGLAMQDADSLDTQADDNLKSPSAAKHPQQRDEHCTVHCDTVLMFEGEWL